MLSAVFSSFGAIVVVGLIVVLLAAAIQIVPQQRIYLVERLGKYSRGLGPGIHLIIPIIEKISHKVSMRIEQLNVEVETKTKDNVFVRIPVSVQYKVIDPYKSYYALSDPEEQFRSYIFDQVRSSLAKLTLDAAFSSKDDIARDVEETLSASMHNYGFSIVNTLITDINPDAVVRAAMNRINAAAREKEAAASEADAQKIRVVKKAEAEAEAKRLSGEGVAQQRKALAAGIAESYQILFDAGIQNQTEEILELNLITDAYISISENSRNSLLLLPSNPSGMGGMVEEIRNTLMANTEMRETFDPTDTPLGASEERHYTATPEGYEDANGGQRPDQQ